MPDPFRVFAASPHRQNTLKTIWPELYNALADLDAEGNPGNRAVKCCLGTCGLNPNAPAAVARLFENGPPACSDHLKSATRPGGWPLRVERETGR